jgi:hypothetical protein
MIMCREYARKFQAALPLELRELVYAQVWDSETVEHAFDNVCDRLSAVVLARNQIALYSNDEKSLSVTTLLQEAPWTVVCPHHACACFRWWQLPFWVQHQFVGLEVAKETAAAYYRAGLPKHLSMLSVDHFHMGVKPADHLHRLELDLSEFEYHFIVSAGSEEHNNRRHRLETINKQSQALLSLRVKRGFELVLKTSWHATFPEGLSVLDEMSPVINVLKLTGAGVRVMAWHSYLGKDYDVADYFSLATEQWEAKWLATMSEELSFWDWRRDMLDSLRSETEEGNVGLGTE